MRSMIILLVFISLFLACSDKNVVDLIISFDDSKWDGKKVPTVGQCQNCGGKGLSPAILIKNIPREADLIIVEFNDKSMPALSKEGGHGAIRFKIKNATEFVAPSVPEQTLELPKGSEMESQHRAPSGKPGAYMAPCGCGNGNKYEATILAVKSPQSGKRLILGRGKIFLGEF